MIVSETVLLEAEAAWRRMPYDLPPWHIVYQQAQRRLYSLCGASPVIKVRHGATNAHSSSLTSLGYGSRVCTPPY